MIRLFTHNDLDGVGCEILAKLAYGEENVKATMHGYDTIDYAVLSEDLGQYDKVFITDISVCMYIAEKLAGHDNVVLFDHHASAFELNKFRFCHIKFANTQGIATCGTEMFYEHLTSSESLKSTTSLDEFVRAVRDYDTWRWTTMGESGIICRKLNEMFYLYGADLFRKKMIEHISNNTFPNLSDKDELVLFVNRRNIEQYVMEKAETIRRIFRDGYNIALVFADSHINDVAQYIYNHFECDIVAVIDMSSSKVSFRTKKDDVDVSVFAKKYGGGGHKKAAGATLNLEAIVSDLL